MMQEHSSHSAVITGAYTHNERIERLWRGVYRCVGVIFNNVFQDEGHLDCLSEVDIFCLNSFTESWNNHPLSTCGNLTPNQLFVQGAMQQNITPPVATPHSNSSATGHYTVQFFCYTANYN